MGVGAKAGAFAAAILPGMACTACHREPSFDERYAAQQQALASEAQSMNAELDRRMTEKPGMENSGAPIPATTAAPAASSAP